MTRLLAVDVYGGTLNAQKQYDDDDDELWTGWMKDQLKRPEM